jgi:chromosome segregation ATPase
MENKTLLATLNQTLQEVRESLAQSDAALIRMRQELAAFRDILQRARANETRANYEYEEVFKNYRELLANSNSVPDKSYPIIEGIAGLSAEQLNAHDKRVAAMAAATKYQEQVRVAERRLANDESNRKSLQNAADDLTWQIKKLSAARG